MIKTKPPSQPWVGSQKTIVPSLRDVLAPSVSSLAQPDIGRSDKKSMLGRFHHCRGLYTRRPKYPSRFERMDKMFDVGEILVLWCTKHLDVTLEVVPIECTWWWQGCDHIVGYKYHWVKMKVTRCSAEIQSGNPRHAKE